MREGAGVIDDLLVVIPGIMGSTLAKDGELVWAPSGGAVVRAIASFGRTVRNLALPAGIGDCCPDDGVEAVSVMPDLHILPGLWTANIGYSALLRRLRSTVHVVDTGAGSAPNLIVFPYDWRLSNRHSGRRLATVVEPALERLRAQGGRFAEARLIFLCHSMGGLVAQWYVEMEGGAEITRKLVTFGTPFRGALRALDQLVNGVRKGIGPLSFDLTSFARSLPSLHELLPEYACIESSKGLRKITEVVVPELSTGMVADGMRFHEQLIEAAAARLGAYDLHPFTGRRQPTATTASVSGATVCPVETIEGADEGGDGTVPCLAAVPPGTRTDSPIIRWIPDRHGALPGNRALLDELEGVLSAPQGVRRGAPGAVEVGVRVEELVMTGEEITVEVAVTGEPVGLQASVLHESGTQVGGPVRLRNAGPGQRAVLGPLPAGAYNVIVGGVGTRAAVVPPVTSTVLVWDSSVS